MNSGHVGQMPHPFLTTLTTTYLYNGVSKYELREDCHIFRKPSGFITKLKYDTDFKQNKTLSNNKFS